MDISYLRNFHSDCAGRCPFCATINILYTLHHSLAFFYTNTLPTRLPGVKQQLINLLTSIADLSRNLNQPPLAVEWKARAVLLVMGALITVRA